MLKNYDIVYARYTVRDNVGSTDKELWKTKCESKPDQDLWKTGCLSKLDKATDAKWIAIDGLKVRWRTVASIP